MLKFEKLCFRIYLTFSTLNFNLNLIDCGAPGWLSWLNVWLLVCLRSWPHCSWDQALRWCWGYRACLRFSLSPSLSAPSPLTCEHAHSRMHTHALSLSKINKLKKINLIDSRRFPVSAWEPYLLAVDTFVGSSPDFYEVSSIFSHVGSRPYPRVRNIWVCAFRGSLSTGPTLFSKLSYIPKKPDRVFAEQFDSIYYRYLGL